MCAPYTGMRTTCLIRQHGYVTALLGDGIIHRLVVDRVELFARGPGDECRARLPGGAA